MITTIDKQDRQVRKQLELQLVNYYQEELARIFGRWCIASEVLEYVIEKCIVRDSVSEWQLNEAQVAYMNHMEAFPDVEEQQAFLKKTIKAGV